VSAAPAGDADELVRRGNAAFDREDFPAALDFYSRAEDTISDPGIVAFNEAVALYKLGRYREAELHFQRCLEQAEGERLAGVLYNLGNSLVQQAQDRDAKLLERAVVLYQKCVVQEGAGQELVDDARHNLGLAQALLKRAKAAGKPSDQDQDPNQNKPGTSDDRGTDPGAKEQGPGSQPFGPGGPDKSPYKVSPGGVPRDAVQTTEPPPPGVGNLPPVPDKDQLAPLSPAETAAYLREAAARIERERREHHRRSAPTPGRNVMDW
jgi:tetratricopeptide (TPR) repeat protein